MENSTISRSLTILTRSSETRESHESLREASSIPVDGDSIQGQQSLASSVTRFDTWPTHSLFIPPSSRPSTPPPEDVSPGQIELIHGVGGCFPDMLSRASTLSVSSENEASIPSLERRSATPDREDDSDGEDLDTPRAPQQPWTGTSLRTPARTIPTRDCIVVQVNPPLTPDLTPRPRKRGTSPLSTLRPAKRSRLPPPREPLGASLALQDALHPPTERPAAGFLGGRLQEDADGANPDAVPPRSQFPPRLSPPVQTDLLTPSTATPTSIPPTPQVKITIEWFSESEIESQLSTLLSSYRAFHPDPDPHLPPAAEPGLDAAERARVARRAFEALFGTHPLRPGDDEGDFLLDEEEEDILDLFMTRIRDLAIPSTPRVERYPDMATWLGRMMTVSLAERMEGTWPFVRRITLALESPCDRNGEADAPERTPEGVMVWIFDGINCGAEEHQEAGLPWEVEE